MTIRVWERGDTVFGQLLLPLKDGGSLAVQVRLTHAQVVRALRTAGIRFSQQDQAKIGSLFGSIGKFVSKVAKSSVLKGVLKIGKSIVGSPLVNLIAPGAALAVKAASGAGKLIAAAKKGNPKAKLALKAAVAQAKLEGDHGQQMPLPSSVRARGPAASAAFRYLVTVKRTEAA
jgi:hypothetical protein